MKKGEKSTRTLNIERIAEFFILQPKSVEKKLKEETKVSNMHVKKAYSNLCNGLPYYDMNAILYEVCKEVAEHSDLVCRFVCEWHIHEFEPDQFRITQSISCWCNGFELHSKTSGIEGINSILNQIGFEGKRLSEPKNFLELVVWKS